MAMSRDLGRYFAFDETNSIHTENSTILTEVRSKRKTPSFPTDYLFHRIVYSPYQPCMYLYDEKRQRKYNFMHDFTLEELSLTADNLVQETILFLTRGHSVRNVLCTCNPHLSYRRYLDYGLNVACARNAPLQDCRVFGGVSTSCQLDAYSQHQFTSEQVCTELGISSLTETFIQIPFRKNVRDVLRNSGEFVLSHTNGNVNEIWELSDKHTVDDKASLFRFVQKNRLGVATNDPKIQYSLLTSDVQNLVREGSLMHLRTQGMLYAVAKIHGQAKCDDDLVALWKKCKT